jgi:hypothetical protein
VVVVQATRFDCPHYLAFTFFFLLGRSGDFALADMHENHAFGRERIDIRRAAVPEH